MVRDLDTRPPRRLFLDGSAGRLAATLELPRREARAAVLLLHPHPLYGGSRRNNVVRHGALGALEAGCAALRLDFRGAGESAGEHDQGRGEVDDAAVALDWLADALPGRPGLVWGYSFGSVVGRALARRRPERLAGWLGVAWPSAFYPPPEEPAAPFHQAVLVGDRDEFADLAVLQGFARAAPAEIYPASFRFASARP